MLNIFSKMLNKQSKVVNNCSNNDSDRVKQILNNNVQTRVQQMINKCFENVQQLLTTRSTIVQTKVQQMFNKWSENSNSHSNSNSNSREVGRGRWMQGGGCREVEGGRWRQGGGGEQRLSLACSILFPLSSTTSRPWSPRTCTVRSR